MGLGSGKKPIPDPGVKKAPDPDPQHCDQDDAFFKADEEDGEPEVKVPDEKQKEKLLSAYKTHKGAPCLFVHPNRQGWKKPGFFFYPAEWFFLGFWVFLYIYAQKREFLGFFQFQEYLLLGASRL
jgi:hypothetical protein